MFGIVPGLWSGVSAGNGGGGNDPLFASVTLLLHLNGANGATTTTDSSSTPATVTMQNGAALSNAQVALGNASVRLDGTNDRVMTNRQPVINAGAFTIEFFCRGTAAQVGRIVNAQESIATNYLVMARAEANGALRYIHRDASGAGTLDIQTAANVVPMNDTAWVYGAVTRQANGRVDIWSGSMGGNATSLANGTSTTNLVNSSGATWNIGSQYGSAEFFGGYIDEVRVTEGVARYSATFTVPSAEFPDS